MAERRDCEWRHRPESDLMCHTCCSGYIVLDGEEHCPFMLNGETKPRFQHLITAAERFYPIQIKLKKAIE